MNDQHINDARHALNQNNVVLASQLLKNITGYKKNAECMFLLGVCKAMANDFTSAEKHFQQAIRLGSANEILYGNLGLAQMHLGDTDTAITSLKKALKHNPEYYDANKNIAVAYNQLNDHINVARYAAKALSHNDQDIDLTNMLARSCMLDGQHDKSISLFRRSLELNPLQPHAHIQLSTVLSIKKEYDAAETVLTQARQSFRGNIQILMALGHFYESRNRTSDALSIYDEVIATNPDRTRAIAGRARCLRIQQKFDEALTLLSDSMTRHPDDVFIMSELCSLLNLKKQYQEAYEISATLISAQGDAPSINSLLSHSLTCIHTDRLEEAEATLDRTLTDPSCTAEIRKQALFQLGDLKDRKGDYKKAFGCYKEANDTIPLPDDIEYYCNVLDKIRSTIDRNFLDNLPASGCSSTRPVFITGMPRSGTSLVEQIIASHPDAYGAGELTDLWKIGNDISGAMNLLEYTNNLTNITAAMMKEFSDRYVETIESLSGAARITDKLPHNFMHIGLIEKLFPNAHIIHCTRHPFDTCLSIYSKKFNDNHVYTTRLNSLGRFYSHYLKLMQHWHDVSRINILDVSYDDMVNDQEATTRKIIDHIELEWDDSTLRYHESERIIMTPSYHQASKAIYTDSLARWKNYRPYLTELEASLGSPDTY